MDEEIPVQYNVEFVGVYSLVTLPQVYSGEEPQVGQEKMYSLERKRAPGSLVLHPGHVLERRLDPFCIIRSQPANGGWEQSVS